MSSLERLAALQGDWAATYRLRGDPSFDSDTPSHATVTPMVGGRFVRIDYSWDEEDVLQEQGPQLGSLLIGHEPDKEPAPGPVTVAWIDSWHQQRTVMVCSGVLLESGVDVFGQWGGGDGNPPWGWRTRIEPAGETSVASTDGWSLKMWVVTPEGEEAPAVDADYRR